MKNALKVLSVLIVAGLICVLSYFIFNRPMPESHGELYQLTVQNMDSLKIIFGEQYVYPDSESATGIRVNSSHGDTLIDYVGKIEYIPFLKTAFWRESHENFEIRAGMLKIENQTIEDIYPNIAPEKVGKFDCYIERSERKNGSNYSYTSLMFQHKLMFYSLDIYYPEDLTPDSGDYEARVSAMEEALKSYALKFK